MNAPQQITLVKNWGPYSAGTNLAVLGPQEDPRPFAVDAARARALLASGHAVDAAAPADDQPAKKPARKGVTRG